MNNWNIPNWLENEIRSRDKKCVYCGVDFEIDNKKNSVTWEHIVNDANIINRENIVLCCFSCNASKGAKELSEWLKSRYCKEKNITENNVSEIVKTHLKQQF